MARPRKKKPAVDHLLITEEPQTEWQKALAHLEENYKLYVGGAVFLILCVVIGSLIRVSAVVKEREINTLYAEAALTEDPLERLEKYKGIVDSLGRWTPEAVYRMGETAIEAERYEEAEEAFNRLLNEYPDSEYVPNAVDGLAFLAWNRGDLEAALTGFERVAQEWPETLVGRRKHYDIGRILEEMERLEEAIAAYEKQIEVFPESMISRRAQQALDVLKEEHPDLFPEEEDEESLEDLDTAEDAGEDEPATPEPTQDADTGVIEESATETGGDEDESADSAVTEDAVEDTTGGADAAAQQTDETSAAVESVDAPEELAADAGEEIEPTVDEPETSAGEETPAQEE